MSRVLGSPSRGSSEARSTATAVALAACAILTLRRRHQPATLAAVAGIFLLASPWVKKPGESVLHAERTFFGAYRVSVDRTGGAHWLAHGTTLHGMQYVEATRRGEPLTYYHRTGPFGRMMAAVPGLQQPGEIAAGIGLERIELGRRDAEAEIGRRQVRHPGPPHPAR